MGGRNRERLWKGSSRNYALILAKVMRWERVLFVDDDIVWKDPALVSGTMEALAGADFVGGCIKGMADDSVVGHLVRASGHKSYDFMSGGFLAFRTAVVSEFFVNEYNEDHIWLYLHGKDKIKIKHGEVEQKEYDPFSSAVGRALWQEFGEILDEGAEEACNVGKDEVLLDEEFWRDVLAYRAEYIGRVCEMARETWVEPIALDVHAALQEYHGRISAGVFVSFYADYFRKRNKWRKFWDMLGCEGSIRLIKEYSGD
jgi:hypothetical protein